MKGGRLSRPRYCSKGAQPVPKAVYGSGCRYKHNHLWCDSNLGPLTLQLDALTTQLLRPAMSAGLSGSFLFFVEWGCCSQTAL